MLFRAIRCSISSSAAAQASLCLVFVDSSPLMRRVRASSRSNTSQTHEMVLSCLATFAATYPRTRYADDCSREMIASRFACASLLRSCTRRRNCAGGRPSRESKATVAPRGGAADRSCLSALQAASIRAHATNIHGRKCAACQPAPAARRAQLLPIDTPAGLLLH